MRRGLLLVLGALLAGALFYLSLGKLWPLAPIDLVVQEEPLERQARSFLVEQGFDLDGYDSGEWIRVDSRSLDYIERVFSNSRAADWIETGLPLFEYRVAFKRAGDPLTFRVSLHPQRGVIGWTARIPRDRAGPALEQSAARRLATARIERALGVEFAAWRETSFGSERLPSRVDHRFVYEREISLQPELRERLYRLLEKNGMQDGVHIRLVKNLTKIFHLRWCITKQFFNFHRFFRKHI